MVLITTECSSYACNSFSYLKPRPPLATDNLPNQTEQHSASQQCDEVPGERALAADDGLGCFRVAKGGGVGFQLHL
jgi:hypothetical protein